MEYVMAEINGNGDLASRDRVPSTKKKKKKKGGGGKERKRKMDIN